LASRPVGEATLVRARRVTAANGGVPIAPSGVKLRYWVPTAP